MIRHFKDLKNILLQICKLGYETIGFTVGQNHFPVDDVLKLQLDKRLFCRL